MTTVTVYLVDPFGTFFLIDSVDQYERDLPDAGYREVFSYEAPLPAGPGVPYGILEDAYREFNVGNSRLANRYRRAGRDEDQYGNRSVSVGDVLVVETDGVRRAYVCASCGWLDVTHVFPATKSEEAVS